MTKKKQGTSSKSSKVAYGANGKRDVLLFDPEQLVIVEDPTHALYDERALMPLTEAMVLNIMHHGIIKPVIITKDADTGEAVVVDGRRRVRHAREANKRLRAQGSEPHNIMAVTRRGDDSTLAGIMVSTNEIREEDLPLNRAKKIARLSEMGKSDEHIAMLFGVSKSTIKNYSALLDCTTPVRNAVEAGHIPLKEAYKLAKLEPAEQKETVAKMIAAGATVTNKREKTKKMRQAAGTDRPTVRRKKEIDELVEKIQTTCADVGFRTNALAVLNWVLGGSDVLFSRKPTGKNAKKSAASADADEHEAGVSDKALAALDEGIEDARAGRTSSNGSFAQYADESTDAP